MIFIRRASPVDAGVLADLGARTFRESHGHSASERDIRQYIDEKYTEAVMEAEITNPDYLYHLIFKNDFPAGYSKIVLSASHPNITLSPVTKLERLYILKEYYDLKLGYELLKFNIEVSKAKQEVGMWLFVWKENKRAVAFYEKTGFKVIGSHDFKLTENHSNPNNQMLLQY